MASLIFIDTNIMLDFYRVRGREGGLAILDHVDANRDKIITSAQVEMEYKKNRQAAILEALRSLKAPDWAGLTLPTFLADHLREELASLWGPLTGYQEDGIT